jgi:CRP/FNR family transcriptional regulator, cyclic AMP receptor protein
MSTPELHEQYVALLMRSGEAETVAAGETVFAEGDPGDRMYVVKSGQVSLTANGRTLETVDAGGLFGEMAVVDREPRSATAVAATDAELVGIDKRRFWFLVQETPYFAEIVMRVMVNRLRRQTQS